MTMDRMVEYLENRGFKAFKYYDRNARTYRFEIVKGTNRLNKTFKYPELKNHDEVDKIQRDFLDDMMYEFELKYDFTGPKKSEGSMEFEFEPKAVYIQPARSNGKSLTQAEFYKKLIGSDMWPKENPFVQYARKDVEATMDIYNKMSLTIKDVIFHEPATIVFWADGTKTVVKCQEGDTYDPEKGLAMAISKKALGNKGNYCNEMQKWLGKYDPPALYPSIKFDGSPFAKATEAISEMFRNLTDKRIIEKMAENKEN